jgi:hypothetical protein
MSASTKIVDKLECVENFHVWKYKITLILEENDLTRFIKRMYQNLWMLQLKQNTKKTQLGPIESLQILSKIT